MNISIESTIELMHEYHKGQMYGNKAYLNGHLVPVAKESILVLMREEKDMEPLVDLRDTVYITGLLHDCIEDTSMTAKKLWSLGYPQDIVDAVVAITKTEGESRKEYLRRVKDNKLALIVKKADTMINLTNSYKDGNYSRIRKYSEQLTFLFKE